MEWRRCVRANMAGGAEVRDRRGLVCTPGARGSAVRCKRRPGLQ
jgi:hypothetical protein